jgi:16S rRNA (guanine966-N2)-methyltransferase
VRIIAGSAKGHRLAPVPAGTRPVSDRAREGVFSSLGPAIEGARVLDAYAGTGALGIEALSRGAEHAMFVDSAPGAIRTIRQNLSRTGLEGRAEVHRAEVLAFLRRSKDTFDVVFADPPYALPEHEIRTFLSGIHAVLHSGGMLVLTRPSRSNKPVIPLDWPVAKRLEYGDTLILVAREDGRAGNRSVSGDVRPGHQRTSGHHRTRQPRVRSAGRGGAGQPR